VAAGRKDPAEDETHVNLKIDLKEMGYEFMTADGKRTSKTSESTFLKIPQFIFRYRRMREIRLSGSEGRLER
jgi:hypothetical protein